MEYLKKVKELFVSKGKSSVILALGIAGIVFIALAGNSNDKETVEVQANVNVDSEYCAELEEKIKSLVSAITGDTDCIVVVTLETGNEYVYADQNTTDSDRTADSGDGSTVNKESLKESQEYIIIKGSDGGENALVVTEKKPQVRGVAIVSAGLDEVNKENISKSVTAMLGITSRKISITAKIS